MQPNKPQVIICLLLFSTVLVIYAFAKAFTFLLEYLRHNGDEHLENSWIFRLALNLLGYGTIFVPGFIIFQYVKRSKIAESADQNFFSRLVRECFLGSDKKAYVSLDSSGSTKPQTFFQETFQLLFCSVGLIGTYVIWGLLQEKIMTQNYENRKGEKDKFEDSQFLVFVNRILAFLLSGAILLIFNQPRHTVPFYKYIYCSFSNIMSSWCQYEALKFISFPTQVLAKASKLIPVMIMGKIVSKKKYKYYEYITALLICVGMAMFLVGSRDTTKNDETITTFSGAVLIVGYMLFDSFTSNWQSKLFTKYSATSLQMMCGVNFFSCLLTTVSLFQQEGFSDSFYFMVKFPNFAVDCFVLSVCSAIGQLFIFNTISCFGPVVFVIIMTVRQALAIILSCIMYRHALTAIGIVGIFVVFVAIFLRIYCGQRIKRLKKKSPNSSSV
ncbi:adenosine 3'-phospho 5'-phosphosulfate transporter 1-like [Planococcus citri]|uniref:adenosine 3'-phospho 5'-phosphosulfate transporter 1-like n=1 Tax=Planococcus citri TaxID=170843 RepID=UPI0031FA3B0E